MADRIGQSARNLSPPSWATLQPSAKFSILEDKAETQPLGLLTQLPNGYSRIRVFRCQNGLPHFNERHHVLPPRLGKAVLSQPPIEIGQKVRSLVGIVL